MPIPERSLALYKSIAKHGYPRERGRPAASPDFVVRPATSSGERLGEALSQTSLMQTAAGYWKISLIEELTSVYLNGLASNVAGFFRSEEDCQMGNIFWCSNPTERHLTSSFLNLFL